MLALYNVIVSSKIRSSILLKFSVYELFGRVKKNKSNGCVVYYGI